MPGVRAPPKHDTLASPLQLQDKVGCTSQQGRQVMEDIFGNLLNVHVAEAFDDKATEVIAKIRVVYHIHSLFIQHLTTVTTLPSET